MELDYKIWSQEYFEEAEKVKRNIEKLKAKRKRARMDEKQTIERNIIRLQSIYYEIIGTAGYLKSRVNADERTAA